MQALSYAQALQKVLSHCVPLAPELAELSEVLGRLPAEPVRAVRDDPNQAKSAMDGYALRSKDTQSATPDVPIQFQFEEVLGAGHIPAGRVTRGKAIRIMTGAVLPDGADAVVKQEDTQQDGKGCFRVFFRMRPGENVVAQGAALQAGQIIVSAGEPVGPQGLGLLASQGLTRIDVHAQPRMALLSLGDELIEPGMALTEGKLYVSNSYTLEALGAHHGARTRRLGIAPDDPDEIEAMLRPCLDELDSDDDGGVCEFVITLGGTLKGDFDFVDRVLSRLGAELHFRRTRINMGGSTLFASRGKTLIFGLPGSPTASWLAFNKFVLPALWSMAGWQRPPRPLIQAKLGEALQVKGERTHFLPARLDFPPGAPPTATPLTKGRIMDPPPNLLADGLIQWPEGEQALPKGTWVPVEWLGKG